MTAKPPPFPARPFPARPFRFTRDQYYEMGRLGYFDHARVELIYGEVVEMNPVNWPHHIGIGLVSDALAAAFAAGYFIDVQQSFPIPGSHLGLAPQPDVAVIPGNRRNYTDHPTVAALLVEVADSTLAFDTTTKAEMYATAGIADYWVLDVESRRLQVFRDPQPLPPTLGAVAYRTHLTLNPDDRVAPLAAPQASILVSDLLP
jgi:Uma2 family endonuclease